MSSLRMVVLGSAVASASAIAGAHNNNTTATGHIVYTTEVVTALTTYCPAPTTLTHGDKTYTITSATTLTITDCPCTISKPVQPTAVPTAPAGDECVRKCTDAFSQCRVTPGSNKSTCASEYVSCLGHNPFQGSGFVTPTACSHQPGVSTTAAVVPSGPGATTAAPSKPVSPTVVPAPAPGCNDKCQATYDQCRGQSGANLSTCVSNFEGCKASCTGASAPAPPPAPAPTAAKPSGNSTTPVTAGAGALAPAKVLLALGAIALL
ncbi:hypothetical protein MAJ_09420, partial [Metarhizium majus ARSEF 297]